MKSYSVAIINICACTVYTIIFLDGIPSGGIRFYKLGPVRKTHCSTLYYLQIVMFSNQFDLSAAEKFVIIEVALFVAMAYVKPWMQADLRWQKGWRRVTSF